MAICAVVYYFVVKIRPLVKAFLDIGAFREQSSTVALFTDTYLFEFAIAAYAFTIIYGRIYMGMHTVLGMYQLIVF